MIERLGRSAENEARKFLLVNVIEKYLPLTGSETEEFERLTEQPEAQEVKNMISYIEERGIEKGIARGIAIGEELAKEQLSHIEERGIEMGIARGIAIGKRNSLLKMLRRKFGELPEASVARIETIISEEELDALFERALEAQTLDELGFSGSV